MMNIQYVKGDATTPQGDGHKIIVHVCNDLGKWGKGFVLAISKHWKEPEATYRAAYAVDVSSLPKLGDVQFVEVEGDITVANIIGQHGIRRKNSKSESPVRYLAIQRGLEIIAKYAIENNSTAHMPRIGCGLAGGKWEKIEPLIEAQLTTAGIGVVVYDF